MEFEEYINTQIDYDSEVREARLDNLRELHSSIWKPTFGDNEMFPIEMVPKKNVAGLIADFALREKIENTANDYGWPREYLAAELLSNPCFFALRFPVNPTRQSIHQKIAAAYLERHEQLVSNFKILNQGGATAKYVRQGVVVSNEHVVRDGKSIDFEWLVPGTDIAVYASHKYTGMEGGSQDNQFNDLRGFIQSAAHNSNTNRVFLAIADGPYYTDERVKELNGYTQRNSVNVFACRSHDVWRALGGILSNRGRLSPDLMCLVSLLLKE